MKSIDLTTLAYHEAGHAVMTWACGFEVTAISVTPGDRHLGCVHYQIPTNEDPRTLQRRVLISVAGLAAETIAHEDAGRSAENRLMGGGDRGQAIEVLTKLGCDTDEDIGWYIAAAEAILRNPTNLVLLRSMVQVVLAVGTFTIKDLAPYAASVWGVEDKFLALIEDARLGAVASAEAPENPPTDDKAKPPEEERAKRLEPR